MGFFRAPPAAAAAAFTLYLDQSGFGSAIVAGSIAKLSSSYSGSCMRVRRSDNVEVDVAFDTATTSPPIATTNSIVTSGEAFYVWAGTSNVFVAKLYGQDGSNHDLVQATAAQQPIICTNGVFKMRNGVLSIESIGATCSLAYAIGSTAHPWTVATVTYFDDTTTANRTFGSQGGNVYGGPQTALNVLAAASQITYAQVAVFQADFFWLANGASSKIYANSVVKVTGNTGSNVLNTSLAIMGGNGGAGPLIGGMQQVVVWGSDMSANATNSYNYNKLVFGLP